jgi:hypothetical protein
MMNDVIGLSVWSVGLTTVGGYRAVVMAAKKFVHAVVARATDAAARVPLT